MRFVLIIIAILCTVIGIVYQVWYLMPASALIAALAFSKLGEYYLQRDPIVWLLRLLERHAWTQGMIFSFVLATLAGWLGQQPIARILLAGLWGASIVLLIVSAITRDRQRDRAELIDFDGEHVSYRRRLFPDWHSWEWAIVVSITLVALLLRLYQIDQLLPFVHGDEGEMGVRAMQVLHGNLREFDNQPLPLFSSSFLDHPTLFYFLQAVALWIGGDSIVSLRVLSAIVGALCVPVIYFAGRLGWGVIAATSAAWLLAVSHLYIQFSRIALNNIETVWFVLLFIAIIFAIQRVWDWQAIAAQTKAEGQDTAATFHVLPYALLGLTVGLAQYMYYGARLLPVMIVPIFFLLWYRRQIRLEQIVIFVLAVWIAYFPQAFFFIKHYDAFLNRSAGVFVLSDANLKHVLGEQYVFWRDVPPLLLNQFNRVARYFIDRGDISSFYTSEPSAIDSITASLFWLGLGVALAAWLRFQEFVLITWLALTVLLAGVLTNDAPNAPRLIVGISAVFLFAGAFLQRLQDNLVGAKVNMKRLGVLLLLTMMAATLYLNTTIYFSRFATQMSSLSPSSIAREIAANKERYQVYLLGAPNLYVENGIFRFMNYGAELYNLDHVADLDDFIQEHPTSKDLFFAVLPYRLDDLELLKQKFPDAVIEEHQDRADRLLYISLKVPRIPLQSQPDSPLPTPSGE